MAATNVVISAQFDFPFQSGSSLTENREQAGRKMNNDTTMACCFCNICEQTVLSRVSTGYLKSAHGQRENLKLSRHRVVISVFQYHEIRLFVQSRSKRLPEIPSSQSHVHRRHFGSTDQSGFPCSCQKYRIGFGRCCDRMYI